MTRAFEIKIPKYLLKEGTPNINSLDYVFSIMVYYWYSGDGLVMSVQHLLDLGGYIDWDNERLKQYLTAACENNNEQTKNDKQSLLDCDAPTLSRYGITDERNMETLN